MKNNRITLREAIKFHGHLGPWLVLGILMGEFALKNLKAEKYFDLNVKVYGANEKPKSCLIDGLQLSIGATYGKGNIKKIKGNKIKVFLHNLKNNKKIKICFKGNLIRKLEGLNKHWDYEIFAKDLYNTEPSTIFNLASITYSL